jgi:hypothetical protein
MDIGAALADSSLSYSSVTANAPLHALDGRFPTQQKPQRPVFKANRRTDEQA